MFIRVMLLIPLLRSIMLTDELADIGASPNTKQALIDKIEALAHTKAHDVFLQSKEDHHIIKGVIRPRTGAFRLLRRSKLSLWRIPGLNRPLWLGEDGEIYFGYIFDDCPAWIGHPMHWKRAEYSRRDERGLERIVNAFS